MVNRLRYNSLKANPGNFQFMILELSDDKCFVIKINAIEIKNTTEVEFLALMIDLKSKVWCSYRQIMQNSKV